jgi:hypothetical protein
VLGHLDPECGAHGEKSVFKLLKLTGEPWSLGHN